MDAEETERQKSQGRSIQHHPSLRDMELFVTVVQNGSFSAAGRMIGLSPASVSRYINALEDKLGVRLLNRTSRKLSLSETGILFHQRAERILGDVREMSVEISQEHLSPRGTLRVHSRILVGEQHIVPALPGFMSRYPDIRVDLTLSNEVVDLIEQNIDVDIRIGQLADSSLIARRLVTSERVLCAAPAYLENRPPIEKPDDLLAHNCLAYRVNMGDITWRFLDQNGNLSEVAIAGNMLTNSGPALKIATLAGLGISLMPDWSVNQELKSGALVRLLPDCRISFTAFENAVYAVYPPTRHLPVKARVFIDYLARIFQENI
ncbi:LysR family transcriptional regulator [Chelativorans sp. AA-79]|uniref:LysR family transcriptional regulator n=1 Tax=Chelativorans sp. AA-79 TaxID=3028735 RepID=UPI0023F90965|nr:LysR family transcriptional regulator [Chelativorans sp. AA-79]WEX09047.1 LysR family transcriptional regulator [Chelativorans sp. AA-79]